MLSYKTCVSYSYKTWEGMDSLGSGTPPSHSAALGHPLFPEHRGSNLHQN